MAFSDSQHSFSFVDRTNSFSAPLRILDLHTTIRPSEGGWVVSAMNTFDTLQRWGKQFGEEHDAFTEAYRLKLVTQLQRPSSAPLAFDDKYFSEVVFGVDPTILLENGFVPQLVKFKYLTTTEGKERGGEISRAFGVLPSVGEIVTFSQASLDSCMRVTRIRGPLERDLVIYFILFLEPVGQHPMCPPPRSGVDRNNHFLSLTDQIHS